MDESSMVGTLVIEAFAVKPRLDGKAIPDPIIMDVPDATPLVQSYMLPTDGDACYGGNYDEEFNFWDGSMYKVLIGRMLHSCPGEQESKDDSTASLMTGFERFMRQFASRIEAKGRSFRDAIIIFFYIRDMGLFASLNAIYQKYVGTINPPSRCCLQPVMSPEEVLRVHVLLSANEEMGVSRQVMHVQSISQWAPSCVGPYSQAAQFGHLLFVSGQLGLEPGSMKFSDESTSEAEKEAQRTLVHTESVCRAMNASMSDSLVKLICFLSDDVRLRDRGAKLSGQIEAFIRGDLDEGDYGENDYNVRANSNRHSSEPLVVYMSVPRLPKNAQVELHPILAHGALVESRSSLHNIGPEGEGELQMIQGVVTGSRDGTCDTFCSFVLGLDSCSLVSFKAAMREAKALVSERETFERVFLFNIYKTEGCSLQDKDLVECATRALSEEGIDASLPVHCIAVSRVGLTPAMDKALLIEMLSAHVMSDNPNDCK